MKHNPFTHRIAWRKVLLGAAYLIAVILVPLAFASVNYYNKAAKPGQPSDVPGFAGALPATPSPDPSKKIAVVLSGANGAEITDTLPPFEILARSGMFNVYSVAPERTVLPLMPGPVMGATTLDFVPHFSFADYDALIGTPPDLIVVPALPGYSPERDASVLNWIRAHAGSRTTLLAICDGTTILADTGLVDGHLATTNPGDFDYVEAHAPTATWLRDLRYVDDGVVVTSSAVSSGIDATLHVVDRFAGRATALDVASQLGYTQTGALDDPRFDPPGNLRPLMAITSGFEGREQLGVLLYDGVSEFGLAGLLDPYVGSASSRAFVMGPERRVVRAASGFLFVPRFTFTTVPELDRVLIPAGEDSVARQQVVARWSAIQPSHPAEDVYRSVGHGESAYDASFEDLARTHNGPLAQTIASAIFYPLDSARLGGAAWPGRELLLAAMLVVLGAATVFGASHQPKLPWRARPKPAAQPA
jgi:putative intracellular protease/amidase